MTKSKARLRRFLSIAPAALLLLGGLATAASASGGGGGGGGGGGTVTPSLRSVTLAPATVVGGGGATGTATFATAASQGAVVELSSSNPAVVGVQSEAVVRPGNSSTAFAVTTSPVSVATTVTITATAFVGLTSLSVTLTVTPGTPPPADTVRVTSASWNAGHLKIQATSTNPNAILSVFSGDGTSFMFELTNNGGGRYSDERGWVFNPLPVMVKSNFGGFAVSGS
jgi:hypothetical protein